MTELVLGLDVGTSSSKGVLAAPDGTIVATAERAHGVSRPRQGWFEHDADAVWWADVVALCRELTPRAGDALRGVCVSGLGPCLLAADADGAPLRPAILYGIDTRAEREIADLTDRYGAAAVLERGGSPLTSQAIGPKLLWLQRHEPKVWSGTRRLLMASSYAVQRLTGEYVLDHHSASQCDPLYDLEAKAWFHPWAQDIAPGLELPRLLWPAEVAGEVTAAAADETGLPAGIPVAAGTIDAWAEATSVGVRRPGDLMLMYGTTMFLVEIVERARPTEQLWSTAGVQPGTDTLAAGMATSGALTAWFRDLVELADYDRLFADAAEVPAGADGLVVLPYFAGERTPLFDPRARGVVAGLTLDHGRGHLFRALLEATAYGVRHNVEAMAAAGEDASRIVAVGGGARSAQWPQIVTDVLQRPQALPRQTIGASYGDALMAAVATGMAAPDADWNPIVQWLEPDAALEERYGELYDIYRRLYPATREEVHRLAALPFAEAGDRRSAEPTPSTTHDMRPIA
jgi:xylulokinase